MKTIDNATDVLDFAYQIIDMHRREMDLIHELEHTKELLEKYQESTKRSEQHGADMFGLVLNGILDQESSINQGGRAMAELELIKQGL